MVQQIAIQILDIFALQFVVPFLKNNYTILVSDLLFLEYINKF